MMRRLKEEAEYERDPDNVNPSFRPNTQISQNNVKGRKKNLNFDNFLDDLTTWQMRKDKKLAEIK